MTDPDGSDTAADIVGQPVEDAAAAVVERPGTPDDEDTVAATLRTVSEDGVVSQDAVEDAIADASMYVSTAEGRAEYAAVEFEDTAEAVADLADVDIVRSRLDAFESEAAAIQSDVETLGERLRATLAQSGDPGAVYEVAREVAELKRSADELQGRADHLIAELDEFERSVTDPKRGVQELGTDRTALAEFLDDLDATIGALEAGEVADAETDAGRVWFEATARHRTNGLVFDDVRSELDSISTLADRQGVDIEDRVTEVERRLTTTRDRWEEAKARLDDVAREEWRSRYDEQLSEIERMVADREPPIDWGAVEAALDASLGDSAPETSGGQ